MRHRQIVAALRQPEFWGVAAVGLFETHISSVIVAGDYAYKLKKPVAFGFVDFTTLADRRRYCEAELRLNRRLAPQLYLDVVAITGSPEHPVVDGDGRVLDYAVRMRAFAQEALASHALARGAFAAPHVDMLADDIARFHTRAHVAPRSSPFGSPKQVRAQAMANFDAIRPLLAHAEDAALLHELQQWTQAQCARLQGVLEHRHDERAIRECHGDLHLGNIVLLEGRPCVFDCIEFNDALRWIDVISEIAFLVMDLHERTRSDLAHRFQNAYLEATGDHGGLEVLGLYLAYRALVRAKVAALRGHQLAPGAARDAAELECRGYLRIAHRFTAAPAPALVITHGVSGSGKTAFTQPLLEFTGAVRIRTDVERKRLAGLAPADHAHAAHLYGPDSTRRTYERVAALARRVLEAGFIAVVDGTFLARWQRDMLHDVARTLDAPFAILAFDAPEPVLRARIEARNRAGRDASDADLAVLAHQLAAREALSADELAHTLRMPADAAVPDGRSREPWDALLAHLRRR